MSKIYLLTLLIVIITHSVFGQINTTSSFIIQDNFENVLRNIIIYVNEGKLGPWDKENDIKIDSIYSYQKFDFEKLRMDSIAIPLEINGTKIMVNSKYSDSFFSSDIEVILKRKKTSSSSPSAAPIHKIPVKNYLSKWMLNLKKESDSTCLLTVNFKGVSKKMTDEINVFLNEEASNQFVIKKYISTNKLEENISKAIRNNKGKSLFPNEIGVSIPK